MKEKLLRLLRGPHPVPKRVPIRVSMREGFSQPHLWQKVAYGCGIVAVTDAAFGNVGGMCITAAIATDNVKWVAAVPVAMAGTLVAAAAGTALVLPTSMAMIAGMRLPIGAAGLPEIEDPFSSVN